MESVEAQADTGMLERVGAALLWPRRAARLSSGKGAAGRAGTDALLLFAIVVAMADPDGIISGLWMLTRLDLIDGLLTLVGTASALLSRHLLVALAASALITVASGTRRELSRDIDFGCVAYVPVAVVAILAGAVDVFLDGALPALVVDVASWLSYAWAALVAVAIVRHVRAGDGGRVSAGWGARPLGAFVLTVALAGGIVAAVHVARDPARARPLSQGERAPAFALPTIMNDGTVGPRFDSQRTEGKVTVIDFWATWCGPCRDTMPAIEELAHAYGSRGVAFISINTEGPSRARAARAFVAQFGDSAIQLSDDGRVASRYKVTTIPHIVVVDSEGFVSEVRRAVVSRARLKKSLSKTLDRLLSTSSSPAP